MTTSCSVDHQFSNMKIRTRKRHSDLEQTKRDIDPRLIHVVHLGQAMDLGKIKKKEKKRKKKRKKKKHVQKGQKGSIKVQNEANNENIQRAPAFAQPSATAHL